MSLILNSCNSLVRHHESSEHTNVGNGAEVDACRRDCVCCVLYTRERSLRWMLKINYNINRHVRVFFGNHLFHDNAGARKKKCTKFMKMYFLFIFRAYIFNAIVVAHRRLQDRPFCKCKSIFLSSFVAATNIMHHSNSIWNLWSLSNVRQKMEKNAAFTTTPFPTYSNITIACRAFAWCIIFIICMLSSALSIYQRCWKSRLQRWDNNNNNLMPNVSQE